MVKKPQDEINLTVIIPVYNSQAWIQETLNKLFFALSRSTFKAEVIVVDDGSTDKSAEQVEQVIAPKGIRLRLLKQKNEGRYLARKAGVEAATFDSILFLDSRVHATPDSLRFLSKQLVDSRDQIWNGHVHVVKNGNPFARFWDAVACIGWRRYFRHPKTTSYSVKDFDYYPKGTGFFFVPLHVLKNAMNWFERNTSDVAHSSDDTLLIRRMNETHDIHLSPEFSCYYHARSTLRGFLIHAFHRGEFFVDGFLRPSTRFYVPLLMVLGISVALVVSTIVFPSVMIKVIAAGCVLFMITLTAGALALGITWKDACSLGVLGVPFAFVYLAGLWTGVWHRVKAKS